MKIEKIYKNIRYILSNENLMEGDKVYPIAKGRISDNEEFIFHNFDFRDFMSGFPEEPHLIKNLEHSPYKPYQISTDHGYGPIESYFKIIKKEKKITGKFGGGTWIEC